MGIEEKRQRVFIVLVGIFLSAMTLLNVVGITKFIQLGPLSVAVGVLPYPLTFLCTDLISELYGKSRANFVVWVGLGLNLFIFAILAMGEFFPSVDVGSLPPWQQIPLGGTLMSPSGEVLKDSVELFHLIYSCSSSAILASMMAYITAQFCDVHIYHFLKKKTQGRHLWLRNNLSTMTSQAIDSMVVISVTFFFRTRGRANGLGCFPSHSWQQLPFQVGGGSSGHRSLLPRRGLFQILSRAPGGDCLKVQLRPGRR